MRDAVGSAFVEVSSSAGTVHEGFVTSQVNGAAEFHWIRIQGVDPRSGSLALARLEVSPSLEQLLGGSGALGHVCARLRSAPSVEHFLADLQEVLERLAYGSSAGAGPGSTSASSSCSSSGSSRVMQLLLQDLDELGWGCLEELDQEVARMTLLHVDEYGREHRLRLTLPHNYPASPPAAATDLPAPFAFSWRPPPAEGTQRGGGGGVGRAAPGWTCSSIADVFTAFLQAVASHQLLWLCLDALDHRTRVLEPPPSVSAARRHLGPPARRLALPAVLPGGGGGGGAATTASSLQLRLDPSDPRGPPPPRGVVFLGPPECVAALRESFFSRMHLWSRDCDPVANLEMLLGQPLPPPQGVNTGGCDDRQQPLKAADNDDGGEPGLHMAECPICMMHLLPVGDGTGGDSDPEDDGGGGAEAGSGSGGGSGGGRGLVPDVVCPTPACGLAFHTPCLAEWLRSLPDTRMSFSRLFGRCPFCSNPITVRA